jgi:hypothetical protein
MHRGCSGKQVTRKSSISKPKRLATTFDPLLERHACHHVSLLGSPRVREGEQHACSFVLCMLWRLWKPSLLARVQEAPESLANKRLASRYRAIWHWHYQCQNKCASRRRLLERLSCGLRLAVQWAKKRYLCIIITGAVASGFKATHIAPHECTSIPYLGRDWPPAYASNAVER